MLSSAMLAEGVLFFAFCPDAKEALHLLTEFIYAYVSVCVCV